MNDFSSWPISSRSSAQDFVKKNWTTKSCPCHNFLVQGSFSYLLQVFTTKWGWAVHNEFRPWPISIWSFAHDFAVLKILKFCLHTNFPAIGGMFFILLTLQSAQGVAKNWTLNCTVTFLLLERSFSHLVLIFTNKMCHIQQLVTLTRFCICSLLCQYMGQWLQIVMKGQQGWVGRIILRMQAFMCLVTSKPSTLNESHPYFYLSSKFYFFFDIWVHFHSSKILCVLYFQWLLNLVIQVRALPQDICLRIVED